jgi:hypothetical protein
LFTALTGGGFWDQANAPPSFLTTTLIGINTGSEDSASKFSLIESVADESAACARSGSADVGIGSSRQKLPKPKPKPNPKPKPKPKPKPITLAEQRDYLINSIS